MGSAKDVLAANDDGCATKEKTTPPTVLGSDRSKRFVFEVEHESSTDSFSYCG